MRLSAIDIGSNAARLLITDVISGPQGIPEFIKVVLVRVPLRLGFDVFDKGQISPVKVEKIIKTVKAYKLLLDVYEVRHLKACAVNRGKGINGCAIRNYPLCSGTYSFIY